MEKQGEEVPYGSVQDIVPKWVLIKIKVSVSLWINKVKCLMEWNSISASSSQMGNIPRLKLTPQLCTFLIPL